jgi:predicted MPP superfamily phosphohydrolase
VNENAPVAICGKTLWIAGTDDPFRGDARLDWALAGIPDGEAVIVLAHSPDILPYAAVMRVSLVLVGHTHGGQVRLPLIGPVYAMTPTMSKFAAGMYHRDQTHFEASDMRNSLKYSAGMFRDDQTQMYVNSGIGLDATYPHRLMCRPEITVFTLRGPGPPAETANARALKRKD